jgi:hypothetical protein
MLVTELFNRADMLHLGMVEMEPTPSKSYYWTPHSPCQLSQEGNSYNNSSFIPAKVIIFT